MEKYWRRALIGEHEKALVFTVVKPWQNDWAVELSTELILTKRRILRAGLIEATMSVEGIIANSFADYAVRRFPPLLRSR